MHLEEEYFNHKNGYCWPYEFMVKDELTKAGNSYQMWYYFQGFPDPKGSFQEHLKKVRNALGYDRKKGVPLIGYAASYTDPKTALVLFNGRHIGKLCKEQTRYSLVINNRGQTVIDRRYVKRLILVRALKLMPLKDLIEAEV